MSKLKSRLVNSVSAAAVALFALSFAFAASQARSDNLDAVTAPPQTIAANAGSDTAAALVVACDLDGTQKCTSDKLEISTDEMERIMSGVSPIELAAVDDESPPPGLHSAAAIILEITQSVTIAAAGDAVDEHEDVTGSITKPATETAEPVVVEASLPNDD
jgi:hypothetical protein